MRCKGRDASRGSPRSPSASSGQAFTARRRLVQDDNQLDPTISQLLQGYMGLADAMAWRTWPADFFNAACAWVRVTPVASITRATGVRLPEALRVRRADSWSAP